MRFSTPIILATLALLATVQAAPTGEGKGAPAIKNKSVVDPDLEVPNVDTNVDLPGDVDVPPEEEDIPVVEDNFDIEECLDDPDLDECPDIDEFDIRECLEDFSRSQCLHKLKEFLKHHDEP